MRNWRPRWIRDMSDVPKEGRRLIRVLTVLLAIEVWTAAYLWQRPNTPSLLQWGSVAVGAATLVVGFLLALRIDLRHRRQ